jgi:hypothetical protein
MADIEQRVAAVEARLDKLKGSGLREWLQTLGPYLGGLVVLLVGFWIKDSVTIALQRQQLDLNYVQQMRDLIKAFDEADTQSTADANAVGLAMYGKYAILPLVERLEGGGDVVPLAAQRGLRMVGSEHAVEACPKFRAVINDRARRFKWQTHKTLIKVIGQSECADARADLQTYRAALAQLGSDDQRLHAFAQRYSVDDGFDAESVAALTRELERALAILDPQVKT